MIQNVREIFIKNSLFSIKFVVNEYKRLIRLQQLFNCESLLIILASIFSMSRRQVYIFNIKIHLDKNCMKVDVSYEIKIYYLKNI